MTQLLGRSLAVALLFPVLVAMLPAQSAAPRWTITPTPQVEIGEDGTPATEFAGIVGAFRLRSGTIVVADQRSRQLRFFDASGRHLRSVGRQGAGPGEFQQLGWVQPTAGDSLVVWDWMQRRAALFAPDGAYARTVVWRPSGTGSVGAAPLAIFADGSFLAQEAIGQVFPFPGGEGEMRIDSMALSRVPAEGAPRWKLPPIIRRETFGMSVVLSANQGRTVAGMSLPFGRQAAWAVWADTLFVADGDTPQIQVVAPNGRSVRTIALSRSRTPVTRAMRDALTASVKGRWLADRGGRTAGIDSALTRLLESGRVPLPSRLPPYARLVVDARGNLWVQDADPTGAADGGAIREAGSPDWTVYDRAGRELQEIRLPEGFRLEQVGAEVLVGVWRDEDGIERVQIFGLRR